MFLLLGFVLMGFHGSAGQCRRASFAAENQCGNERELPEPGGFDCPATCKLGILHQQLRSVLQAIARGVGIWCVQEAVPRQGCSGALRMCLCFVGFSSF